MERERVSWRSIKTEDELTIECEVEQRTERRERKKIQKRRKENTYTDTNLDLKKSYTNKFSEKQTKKQTSEKKGVRTHHTKKHRTTRHKTKQTDPNYRQEDPLPPHVIYSFERDPRGTTSPLLILLLQARSRTSTQG